VVAARGGFATWFGISAYLRGQILYRIAEMLEGRSEQFVAELAIQGVSRQRATTEVAATIDRLVYYAGWTDKYQQVFSSVNPVASSHFNFSPVAIPVWPSRPRRFRCAQSVSPKCFKYPMCRRAW
jgi:acyl-CoA reductase-like NAD-dependent aldehyde dehydrogenase